MKRHLLLAILLVGLPAVAAERDKPAWKWTLEERLEERLNPTAIEERIDAHAKAHDLTHDEVISTTMESHTVRYIIDGSRDPELFLPHELLEKILVDIVDDRESNLRNRELIRAQILDRGWDFDEFWEELATLAAPYLWMRRATDASTETGKVHSLALCSGRALALDALRDRYGREKFDQFLYEAVAPHVQLGVVQKGNEHERLSSEARGCS